jgi:protein-disulfide isomerase
MKGKNAFIAVLALIVIAGGLFVFSRSAVNTPPMPAMPETATVSQSGEAGAQSTDAAQTAGTDAAQPATDATATEGAAAQTQPDPNYDHAAALAQTSAEEHEDAAIGQAASDVAVGSHADDNTATAEGDKAAATGAAASAAAPTDQSLLTAPKGLDIDVRAALMDRVLGNEDAPVTIIEYASMTCPHCAHFHNELLAQVKRDVLDTGKAKLVMRDFPIDTVALRAAMMARCAPADKYFDLVEVIFKNQERWARSDDPLKALTQLGTLAGMSDDYIKACINNPELEAALLKRVKDAQTNFSVNATPTFVFNTQEHDNVQSVVGPSTAEDITGVVNKLLSMH